MRVTLCCLQGVMLEEGDGGDEEDGEHEDEDEEAPPGAEAFGTEKEAGREGEGGGPIPCGTEGAAAVELRRLGIVCDHGGGMLLPRSGTATLMMCSRRETLSTGQRLLDEVVRGLS